MPGRHRRLDRFRRTIVAVAPVGDVRRRHARCPHRGPAAPGRRTRRPRNLVHDPRRPARWTRRRLGAEIKVTGRLQWRSTSPRSWPTALPVYLLVVVGLALILLMLVFRSIVVPDQGSAGLPALHRRVVRRRGGGLPVGLVRLDGLASTRPSPIISFLPIILIGVLFGLAMDYEVFLVARMRESYAHGEDREDRRRHRLRARVEGGHRGRHHHDQRVRRLHPGAGRDHRSATAAFGRDVPC